jgi:hypothetical protein
MVKEPQYQFSRRLRRLQSRSGLSEVVKYIYTHTHTYIYIYIEREREREREQRQRQNLLGANSGINVQTNTSIIKAILKMFGINSFLELVCAVRMIRFSEEQTGRIPSNKQPLYSTSTVLTIYMPH